jgi:hypothetical protein
MREKYLIIVIFFLMFGSAEISAQMTHSMPEPVMNTDCDDSDDCETNCCGTLTPPPGLPIDFGISALIAAGLALGIHHIKNRK